MVREYYACEVVPNDQSIFLQSLRKKRSEFKIDFVQSKLPDFVCFCIGFTFCSSNDPLSLLSFVSNAFESSHSDLKCKIRNLFVEIIAIS